MEGELLQHILHEHPLILKAEEPKTNDITDNPDVEAYCDGCSTPISGPFYSCKKCRYFLHKVCAELPKEMNHPMHPHPLTLLSTHGLYSSSSMDCICDMCQRAYAGFVYHCSICKFDVDTICASASHTIIDKCHMHPLVPIQTPTSFPCHICLKKEEGVSYKCTICPFWVHQNCILVSNTVKHSEHHHLLTLLPSVPSEYRRYSEYCDICHDKLFLFQCSYCCEGCKFFAHVNCGRSETPSSLSRSRDQDTEMTQDLPHDSQCRILLPMKQESTDLISHFVENHIDRSANIDNKISHFDHDHPLIIIDEQINERECVACAIPIFPPFYGCIECNYFLHKCCTELPKQILHPSHPQHQLTLKHISGFFRCKCCDQWGNGFNYICLECPGFDIDIKCASLIGRVYHEAHKHPLIPTSISSRICTACNIDEHFQCTLQCNTCSFNSCFVCAMAPPIMEHRYGKSQPFVLTYSPPENHYNEYICEICEGRDLNPKYWFYHCSYADQFAHLRCMLKSGADANINYDSSYMYNHHEHLLDVIRCTYDSFPCSYCHEPLMTGFSIGLKCVPCNLAAHLKCHAKRQRDTNVIVCN